MAGLTWRGTRSSGWRAAAGAALLAALLSPAVPAAANHGAEAGLAVRQGWPRLTADLAGGASMNLPIEGSTGKSGWFKHSSPTLADLDGNGTLEIVIGSLDGRVYAFRADGSMVPGLWPRRVDAPSTPAGPINGTPAVGDIDGDGRPEIVVGSDNGWVFAFAADGTIKPGWPQFTGYNADFPANCATAVCTGVLAGPTLADLDGDGAKEVIVGSASHFMFVWRGNGSLLPGWPRDLWDGIASSAAVGDLDGDGSPEIVVGSDVARECFNCAPFGHIRPGGLLHAFRTDGTQLPGWPRPTDSFMTSSPVLADLDGNGRLDVLAGGGFFLADQHLRGHNLTAYRPDGSILWRFSTPAGASNSQPGGVILGHAAVGNLTGDARPEIAVGDFAGVIRLLRPDGSVIWERSGSPSGPNGAYFSGPVLADLTGDGVPEVVATDANWRLKAWDVAGNLVADSALLGGGVTRHSMWNSPAVGDLDGNGRNEVVVGSAAANGPPGPDLPVAAGLGEVWVFDTNGVGAGPFPQFHSRVIAGNYHLFGAPRCTAPAPARAGHRPAVFRGGVWYFRSTLTSGPGDGCNVYGQPGDIPVVGDWNNDGIDTLGVFRPSEGRWYLSNSLGQGSADGVFRFGSPGDIPVVGDWNNDGTDTIGVFRPSEGRWYLSNFFDRGFAEGVFPLGSPGDIPVVGDWNNDGTDTIGVFRPSEGRWYLSNFFDRGFAEGVTTFGSPGDLPVVGDWNNDGVDTIGIFRPGEGRWYLTNTFDLAGALGPFQFGGPGDRPVHWG